MGAKGPKSHPRGLRVHRERGRLRPGVPGSGQAGRSSSSFARPERRATGPGPAPRPGSQETQQEARLYFQPGQTPHIPHTHTQTPAVDSTERSCPSHPADGRQAPSPAVPHRGCPATPQTSTPALSTLRTGSQRTLPQGRMRSPTLDPQEPRQAGGPGPPVAHKLLVSSPCANTSPRRHWSITNWTLCFFIC